MPSNVPTGPVFATAVDVIEAMGEGGLECRLLRRVRSSFGSRADCVAEIMGTEVENVIHVLDPVRFSRDDIGDSIAAGREVFRHTIVAAGNWYIWVTYAMFAPQVAKALHGVVLPPTELGQPTPPGAG
ncbi:hypothetical protein DNK56_22980 [Streptomyces sp. AC1-42W]|nr:hypothetical protein DNK56_22980 [Streptomyces sp. AC1-42W]PZT80629.1 hypothetical protein DNK55_09710 [Streptomyces sp. AC1-42T]